MAELAADVVSQGLWEIDDGTDLVVVVIVVTSGLAIEPATTIGYERGIC